MKHLGKRIVALVIMTAAVLGTTVALTLNVVLTVNGARIRADEYASFMVYNMRYMESQYAQFGMTGLWDNEETAAMVAPSLPDATKEQATYTYVVLENFKKAGLKLTQEQLGTIDTAREQMKTQAEQMGTTFEQYIAAFGFNEKLYNDFMYVNLCYSALNDYYYGVNGVETPDEAEISQYLQQNYLQAKHILIGMTDPMTGETTRTDEQAKAEAQKALDRINAGEDFDAVMKELSEDAGSQSNPDGYIFTEGDMVAEFYDGAKALKENEMSGLVQSEFGYHIIKRVPLNAQSQMETLRATVLQKMGKTMDGKVTGWMEQAKVNTTDLFKEINYQNVYDYAPVEKQTLPTMQ